MGAYIIGGIKMKNWDILLNRYFRITIYLVILIGLLKPLLWINQVNGVSMESSFENGDYIAYSRLLALIFPVEVQDVIVIQHIDQHDNEVLLKRVIGIEGDHVVISKGQVYVNGTLLNETYSQGNTEGVLDIHVPKGMYFVLGDNRPLSDDSRSFGCIEKEQIYAKVIFKFF